MFPFFLFSPHTLWLILLTFIFLSFFYVHRSILGIHDEELFLAPKTSIASSPLAKDTSGKRAIGGAPFWLMRGAYGMRHQCHATSNSLLVAHLPYAPRIICLCVAHIALCATSSL
jgi:hypothetical protein